MAFGASKSGGKRTPVTTKKATLKGRVVVHQAPGEADADYMDRVRQARRNVS